MDWGCSYLSGRGLGTARRRRSSSITLRQSSLTAFFPGLHTAGDRGRSAGGPGAPCFTPADGGSVLMPGHYSTHRTEWRAVAATHPLHRNPG